MSVFGQLASLMIRPEKDAGFEDTFASRFGAAPLDPFEAATLRQRQFTNRQQGEGAPRAERVMGGLADLTKAVADPVVTELGGYSRSRVAPPGPMTEEEAFRINQTNPGKGVWEAAKMTTPLRNPAAAVSQFAARGGQLLAETPKAAPAVVQGIKAYHGSPHDFDRFDLSRIGTGEGAQAYGHGLYFAENEGVARGYRERLSSNIGNLQTPHGAADRALGASRGDVPAALETLRGNIRSIEQTIERMGDRTPPQFANRIHEYRDAIKLVEDGYRPGGRMYEVSLNARPEQFLDWDRPLNAQDPAHRAQLLRMSPNFALGGDRPIGFFANEPLKNPKHTETLREAGISGIRYLDEGSRGRQHSNKSALWQEPLTSNYVVFDPGIIDILRKYGLAGATAAPLGALAAQDNYRP